VNFYIEHLGLPARDPVALKDWYVRTLDGQLLFADGQTPPTFFVQLPGGVALEIYQAQKLFQEPDNNKISGWRHVALRVDSLEAARATLEGRGVKFTGTVAPAGGGGRVLYLADPEGNLLHLVERPADSRLR
jgi:glyoxylase I family protein